MFFRSVLTVCFLSAAVCAGAQEQIITPAPQAVFDLQWFVCEQDADCSVIEGACGVPTAVNTKYSESAGKHYADIAGQADCREPYIKPLDKTFKAFCSQERCSLAESAGND